MKITLILLSLLFFACGGDSSEDKCKNTNCGTNKACNTETGKCECKAGYYGDACEKGPCTGLSFETNSFVEKISDDNTILSNQSGDYKLSIQFQDETPKGEYNLASVEKNDNYKTCIQCIIIEKQDDSTTQHFFQESGTLKVSNGDAKTGKSLGEILNLRLIEVTIDENSYQSTPVNNGECLDIQTVFWNTQK